MRATHCEVLRQRLITRTRIALLLATGICALFTSLAHAQATRDFSKVEVKTIKIADNFYALDFDGVGSTVGVLTGQDGVLMVDAQFAPMAPKIEAAIRKLSSQPIRYVIDTHVHADHTGGNEYFSRLGATIIAREQVRTRLLRPRQGGSQSNAPVTGLPKITYDNSLTLHFDGEEVRLIAVPRAHTDGDTLVYFPGLDIMVTGDLFRPTPYPHIDLANGGTLQGALDGLAAIVGRAGPNTKIIAGHGGPMADRAAVIAQRDLIRTVRDRVAALIAHGKSEDEVVAAKVTAGLDARVPQSDITVDRFVREVYGDLKATH